MAIKLFQLILQKLTWKDVTLQTIKFASNKNNINIKILRNNNEN